MRQKINQSKQKSLKQNWNLLVKNIVRPPRKIYVSSDLGSINFSIINKKFSREDHQVSHNNKTISLSIFKTSDEIENIILYLHSNSSNKLEATQLLHYLPNKFDLACFDFFGCGINQMQDKLTLGLRQAEQTKTVVEYLKKMKYRVAIWGRSMGAATALLYGQSEIIIADSAFLTFKKTFKQASMQYAPPVGRVFLRCFFSCIFFKLRNDVKKAGSYDINDLNIQKAISKINLNTLLIFLTGNNDEIISYHNSQIIYDIFKGKNKHIQIFQGSHNSNRPQIVIQKIMNLIKQKFSQKAKNKIPSIQLQNSDNRMIIIQ